MCACVFGVFVSVSVYAHLIIPTGIMPQIIHSFIHSLHKGTPAALLTLVLSHMVIQPSPCFSAYVARR